MPGARLRPSLATGAVAGVVAGLVMTVWKMAEAAIAGVGVWRPPNLIATIALGPSANHGEFSYAAFAVGMLLHVLTSIVMGVVYAAFAARFLPRVTRAAEFGVIIGYALLNWAAYEWLIMPWLAPVMDANVSPTSLAIAHVVFALGFAGWWIPRTRRPRV
jgi:uncharacterized membrane protein YagU involved in acid resistance